jgi:hypothetical protein
VIRAKYHFVLLADPGSTACDALKETIQRRVSELGIDPNADIVLAAPADTASLDYDRQPVVAAFFAAASRSAALDAAVDTLKARGVFVLPVVNDVTGYTSNVPTCLHSVNAHVVAADDHDLESVAQRLLEEIRLLREKRLLFISYRRTEAAGVAEQLYRVFDERAFDVFLDTHSVRSGLEFQSVLWDQIADADVLILLDTPTALTSRWVQQELSRAHTLGLEVLLLVWPGHTRTPGTDFCEPLYLEPSDFSDPTACDRATTPLSDAASHRVATLVESLRARSIATRRTRIIGELQREATAAGFGLEIQPARFVEMHRSGGAAIRLYPIVGHPDSRQVHFCHDGCGTEKVEGILLYDPLGMQPPRSAHLAWLNGYLPLKAIPVTDLPVWLRTLP